MILSRLLGLGPDKTVLALANDATRAAVEAVALGMGVRPRLRLHATVDALIADRAFGTTSLMIVAAEAPLTMAEDLAARCGTGPSCDIALLTKDPLEQITIRDIDAATPGCRFRMRPISATSMAVRALLSGPAKPDRILRLGSAGSVPILIAGRGGPLAAQLLIDLLRQLQLPGLAAEITLAGDGMDILLARMHQALPELLLCGRVTAQASVAPTGMLPALMFAVGGSPDDAALRGLDPSGLAPILHPALPSWEEVGQAHIAPAADSMARRIHELHVGERQAAGLDLGDLPSLRPWASLPERFREASRLQAHHVPLIMRWAGARPGRSGSRQFEWTAAELAALAEAEHQRWAAAMRLEGWRYAPTRDDARKHSPFLVPFAALTEETRDLDTLPVRAALAKPGVTVSRDVIVAVDGDAAPSAGFASEIGRSLEALRARFTHCLVLRIGDMTALMAALATAAGSAGIPVELVLPQEPGAPVPTVLAEADRVVIGPARLPGVAHRLRVTADGRIAEASC